MDENTTPDATVPMSPEPAVANASVDANAEPETPAEPSLMDLDQATVDKTLRELVEFEIALADHGLSMVQILKDLVRSSLGILI